MLIITCQKITGINIDFRLVQINTHGIKGGCHTKLKRNGFIERIELCIFSLLT